MPIWDRLRSKPIQDAPKSKADDIITNTFGSSSYIQDDYAGADSNYWGAYNQHHYPDRIDGWKPDISMARLMHVGTSSPLLKSTLDTFVTYSIGSYFDIKVDAMADVDTPASDNQVAKAKDAIHRFMRSFNLHSWNRDISFNLWLTGNCFITPLQYKNPKQYSGLITLPMSSFEGIRLDNMGAHSRYVKQPSRYDGLLQKMGWVTSGSYSSSQYTTTGKLEVMAYNGHKGVIHLARGNKDASPWGEGLGQIMCRTGAPFTSVDGTTIYRPALYKAESMIAHTLWQILYSGAGRYAIFLEDSDYDAAEIDKLTTGLNKMPPNRHLVFQGKGRVDTLAYGATGKYEPIIEDLKNRITLALGNPMIKLLGDQSFAYASSETAAKSMIPMIAGYEHDHTHILETYVLKPIIKATFPAKPDLWDKLDIKVIWGDPNAKKVEEVKLAIDALRNVKEYDLDAPRRWLNNAGFPLPEMTEEQRKEKEENKANMQAQMMQGGQDQDQQQQPPPQLTQEAENLLDGVVRNTVERIMADRERQMHYDLSKTLKKHLEDMES